MEIPKNKKVDYWLFADNLTGNELFEFVEFKKEKSNNGKMEIPIFVLAGNVGEYSGDFKLSTWNIENLNNLIEKYGADASKWGTPKFKAEKTKNNKINLVEIQ